MEERYGGQERVPSEDVRLAHFLALAVPAMGVPLLDVGGWEVWQGVAPEYRSWFVTAVWLALFLGGLRLGKHLVWGLTPGRLKPVPVPAGVPRLRVRDRPGRHSFGRDVALLPELLRVDPSFHLSRAWYRIPYAAIGGVERVDSGVIVSGRDLHRGPVDLHLECESVEAAEQLLERLRDRIPAVAPGQLAGFPETWVTAKTGSA